jgi:inner membrane protein
MPTIFTHAIAASAIGAFQRGTAGPTGPTLPRGFWILTILCAMLPDADVVAFDFGLEYGHMLGHRGLSHSLAFAALIGAAVAWALGRGAHRGMRRVLFLHFFLATASHGLLDAFVNDGLGVAFFAPFSGERYFFPWRPLEVAPIGGHGFFTASNVRGGLRWLEVLWSEVLWVWIPAGIVVLAARLTGRR